jgi:hypothetical protein
MSSNEIRGLPPFHSWLLVGARLTAFTLPAEHEADNWWKDTVGRKPETRQIQSKTNEQTDVGVFEEGVLSLSVHPVRVEWQYNTPEPEGQVTEVPSLGSVEDRLDAFHRIMNKWLRSTAAPDIIRLAFGATLAQPVESLGQAYQLLARYTPVNLIGESSDFLYQINRTRILTAPIEGLQINRLSKWSAIRVFQSMRSPAVSLIGQNIKEFYACRLELDINSPADFDSVIPGELTSDLFGELVRLGTEIATEGDIP